ncbi:MAG: hypothetical protein RML40_02975 [Bacteroidota bacterium]|nr:hypothetical protein [Candidatus Kapabacteria bacterium]MDW8219473.1 hypothetical protein [Bacteroidota bacterium]
MKTRLIALTIFCTTQATLRAQQEQVPFSSSATATMSTATVSSTTSSVVPKPQKPSPPEPSKALRIFLESRHGVARPEPYESLLTIEEDGRMKFEFHTAVSNRRDSIRAKLKPHERAILLRSLDIKKFFAAEPEQKIVYADVMQMLTVEKDRKSKTIRFMIDIRKPSEEAVEQHIQQQLGPKATKDIWLFVQIVRALNKRFRF